MHPSQPQPVESSEVHLNVHRHLLLRLLPVT